MARISHRVDSQSTKGHEGQKDIHKGQKKISTKGHEGLRRATKDYEGPLRGWRRLKRDSPKVGKGEKISTKGGKGSVKGAKDESAKGSQGVGKDSKGVREGPRRTLRFSTNAHSKIEPISFLCNSLSSCFSCLSCVSMFNDAANRISETWPVLPIGHKAPLFYSRMIRPVVCGGGSARRQTGVSQRVHGGFLRSRPPDTPAPPGRHRLGNAGGTPALPASLHPMTSSHQGHQIA